MSTAHIANSRALHTHKISSLLLRKPVIFYMRNDAVHQSRFNFQLLCDAWIILNRIKH